MKRAMEKQKQKSKKEPAGRRTNGSTQVLKNLQKIVAEDY
jgi:hypothetical protein